MKRFSRCVLPLMALLIAVGVFALRGVEPTGATRTARAAATRGDVLLVNREHPLADDFQPRELIALYEQPRAFQLAASDILLEREVYEAANRMFARAADDGVEGFIVTSGYRTARKQRELFEADTNGVAAAPGTSEHQTGLAFDVTARRDSGGFGDTPQFDWLCEHCWEYGFILRYPETGRAVTGFAYEPWHYRYVGSEIALEMRDSGQTLEEYCEVSEDA